MVCSWPERLQLCRDAGNAKSNTRTNLRKALGSTAILTDEEALKIENDFLQKGVTFEKFMEAFCPASNPKACTHEPFCEGELYR